MTEVEKRVITPGKINEILTIPNIAVPTLILAATSVTAFSYTNYCLYNRSIDPYLAIFINTWAIFAGFTPMHDAAHGSIATNKSGLRWINNFIGYSMACLFPAPFPAFKHLHLQHHKHTNEPGLDVDSWAAGGPTLLLPFRWWTTELMYYYHYLPELHNRPREEIVGALTQLFLAIYTIYWLLHNGYTYELKYGWLIPGRLAMGILACCFDYLPHRAPAADKQGNWGRPIPRTESDYTATCVVSVFSQWDAPALTWLLLYQNYHNIHHLAPYIPFYQYSTAWSHFKNDLRAKGTVINPIWGNRGQQDASYKASSAPPASTAFATPSTAGIKLRSSPRAQKTD